MDFIESQVLAYPELAESYSQLGSLYTGKLWHQLTIALSEFINNEGNRRGDNFIQIYEQFISKFESKLNQLEFAKIIAVVARSHGDNPTAAESFFKSMLEKKLSVEASFYLECLLWLFKLLSRTETDRAQTLKDVKGILESKRPEMEALQGLADTCVHSAYYQLATEYYKEAGPPEAYYKHALMLLAYTPMDSLTKEQATALATDMSLAAISGDGVYNFGEVLATPIVEALVDTPSAWLGDMLRCFNRGDIAQFNLLVEAHHSQYYGQPALQLRHNFIKEKVTLLALMNLLLETPAHDRNMPFALVAERTCLPLNQVEWLVIKAMSLGLIKGSMDEVDQILHVDWVQPRVLDMDQMAHLAERLGEWGTKVTATANFIEDQTPELFA
mmetsp:Transcript_39023/g.52929  ORF Transcript_39023/g.52929 Transcript_39023/m.52929 type:complete len:386 (-) Transcript_39023:514-1671(-)